MSWSIQVDTKPSDLAKAVERERDRTLEAYLDAGAGVDHTDERRAGIQAKVTVASSDDHRYQEIVDQVPAALAAAEQLVAGVSAKRVRVALASRPGGALSVVVTPLK